MAEEKPWRRNIRRLPWVRELHQDGGRCQGYRWSQMSRKGYEQNIEQYRCKLGAKWSYTFLKSHYRHPGKAVRYCVHHLYSEGVWSMTNSLGAGEHGRVERWFEKHGVI
jgi:hypothetical protein